MIARAQAGLHKTLQSFSVPVTRPQWDDWASDNELAYRKSMVTVGGDRREISYRVYARGDLPAPIARIQPQATYGDCRSDWARRLMYRTGWHGVKTKKLGFVTVFLIHLHHKTHYVYFPLLCNDPLQSMSVSYTHLRAHET